MAEYIEVYRLLKEIVQLRTKALSDNDIKGLEYFNIVLSIVESIPKLSRREIIDD